MKKFIIETVKWKWADAVKSKNVYRDDEFIKTDTKEDALEAIDFLLSTSKGSYNYTITVLRDNVYYTYHRHSMPCLGGLVKYKDSHGEKYFMNPYFPRDIYVAFPEGEIIFIACYRQQTKNILKNPWYEFLFSSESPWIAAFGNQESIIFKDTYFVLTNMNTDPTVFYSLMRMGGLGNGGYGGMNGQKDRDIKAQILFNNCFCVADPRRLAGQRPLKTSGGTWSEGYGYTRPYNEAIFRRKLPVRLKDFGSLPDSRYPDNPPHDKNYFINKLKEEFNFEINQSKFDKKTNDVLLASWEFFKEKAKELKE